MAEDAAFEMIAPQDTGAGVGIGAAGQQGDAAAGGEAAAHALVAFGIEGGEAGNGVAPPQAAVDGGGDPPDQGDGPQPPADGASEAREDDGQGEQNANPACGQPEEVADSDDDDNGGSAIDGGIARVATDCGCLAAITDALPSMCEAAGFVPILTTPLLGAQVVILGNEVTSLKAGCGVVRVRAVAAYVDKLFATSQPPTAHKDGLIGALLAVLDVLHPEPAAAPPAAVVRAGGAVPMSAGRDESPDTGFITKICAYMEHREDRKTSSKECSATDMRELGSLIAPFLGSASKGSADLASVSQTKTILNEIGKYGRFPSEQSCQPDKIIRFGGDASLAAPKAEKGKELMADETTCSRVLRGRFRTFCITVGAVFLRQPDTPIEAMSDAASAALNMHEALAEAEHLVSHKQVETAINNCLHAARRAQNGDDRRRRGFAIACERGAQAIHEANTLASTFQAMGVATAAPSAAPTAGPSGTGDDKPITMKQLKQALSGKGAGGKGGKGAGKGGRDKKREVELPDKSKKYFERKQGGNPDCPVMCTNSHPKHAYCHLNHSQK